MRTYRAILEAVDNHTMSIEDALAAIRQADVEDLGFARLDHQRARRKGFAEVVYCEGKTPEQASAILTRLAERGNGNVLGTRADRAVFERLEGDVPDAEYEPLSRTIVTPGSGLSLEATSPLGTPKVASLKYIPICEAWMFGAAVVRFEYMPSWSLACGG